MLRNWLSRPLTASPIQTALIYGMVALMLNNSINKFWVTEQTPDGLTGFAGYAVLFLSVGFCTWLSNRENDWLREIKRSQKTG